VNDAGAIRTANFRRPLTAAGGALAGFVIVFAGLLAGTGWLYVFRGLHWLDLGPRVADALPLLQLASSDGQPLLRVMVAWLLAGAVAGVALAGVAPSRRAALALVLGLIILLIASQASYALARNLRFSDVLFSRKPGFGPVLEAVVFAVGCALPRPVRRRRADGARRRSFISLVSGFDDRGLGGGEHRDSAQDDGDRQQVGRDDAGTRS
jgi:hypothetical protein